MTAERGILRAEPLNPAPGAVTEAGKARPDSGDHGVWPDSPDVAYRFYGLTHLLPPPQRSADVGAVGAPSGAER